MRPPLNSGEVQTTVKSLDREKYFYKCNEDPLLSECQRHLCVNRKYGIGSDKGDAVGEWLAAVTSIKIGRSEDLHGTMIVDDETPIWITAYDVELCITYDILNVQKKMQQLLALNFRTYPIGVAPKSWDKILREWIEKSQWVDLSQSDTRMGHIYDALCAFCRLHGGADVREEVGMGKVWRDEEGRYIFSKTGFREFLVKRNIISSREASQKEVTKVYAVMRKNIGCEDKPFKFDLKGNHSIAAWRVKPELIETREVEPPVRKPSTEF